MSTSSYWTGFLVMVSMFFGQPGKLLAEDEGRVLFDFTKPEVVKDWQTVNDGVMGGLSEGSCRITEDGTMEFYGTLSLENRGGFASVRSKPKDLRLSEADSLLVRLKGDGREYYVSLYVPTPQIAFSYRAAVQTKSGEWQQIRIPLRDFQATSFGRAVRNAKPVDPDKVNSIGFLLADKKAGVFKLQVAWVKTVPKQAEK